MDMGPGPGLWLKKGVPAAAGSAPFLGPGHGPGPISIMAEHMRIKANQQAINKQYVTGSLAYYMYYSYNIFKKKSKHQKSDDIDISPMGFECHDRSESNADEQIG